MANIDVVVRSLWGAAIFREYTVSDAITIEDLILLVAADDNLDTNFYGISLGRDRTKNDLTYGDSTTSLSSLGVVDGDGFITYIKRMETKELREKQKLDIAQAKRQANGDTTARFYRTANIYNINDLPTKYVGNIVVDNPNPGGLKFNRPFTSSTEES